VWHICATCRGETGGLTNLATPLHEIAPHLVADPRPSRGTLFRIHRDTRFSHDKRPYKTHVAMRFSHPGKDVHSPGFYLHLEAGGCFAAAGLWRPEPSTLFKVRSAIVARPREWGAVRELLNWDDASNLSRPPSPPTTNSWRTSSFAISVLR
jgi:uncharacterized protein (TIGR02453 family)